MASDQPKLLTFEEYVAEEQRCSSRFQFWNGRLFRYGVASPAHAVLQANLARLLRERVATGRVFEQEWRLFVGDPGFYTYTDVGIVCEEPMWDGRMALTNPRVLVQIVSASTRWPPRFESFRNVAALKEYVAAEQDCCVIQHHRRLADGRWESTRLEGEGAVLELASVGVAIPLREIYAGVSFELAEQTEEDLD